MRKMFLFAVCTVFYAVGVAQTQSFFNPIQSAAKVPQSPEVAAFDKFSNSVNMYTGVPTIALPLYTFKGRELSLPISLSYDASGIKVEQIATHVGLGWSLNYGGVISRQVNGHPDDYVGGSTGFHPQYKIYDTFTQTNAGYLASALHLLGTHTESGGASKAWEFYKKYKDQDIDYQPDTFSVSVNGLSGTIFVDYWDTSYSGPGDYKAYLLEDPLVEVEYHMGSLGKFIVTDSSGNVYTFEQHEVTENTVSPPEDLADEYTVSYITAWYLTKMESANGFDTFTFTYETDDWNQEEEYNPLKQRELEYSPVTGNSCAFGNLKSIRSLGINDFTKEQVRPTKVSYSRDGSTFTDILKVRSSTRNDLYNVKRITGLDIYDRIHTVTTGNEILKVDFFNTSYFGSGTGAYDLRLKLDSLKVYRDNINDAKKYTFEYQSPQSVPPRLGSKKMDYWGYYNGQSNPNLAPWPMDDYNADIALFETDIPTDPGFGTNQLADRRPYFNYAKIGTLTSITYPTGGKTAYEYEEHWDNQDKIVGGLRLRKTAHTTEDPVSGENLSYETYYYYGDFADDYNGTTIPGPTTLPTATNYTSSGQAQQYIYFSENQDFDIDSSSTDCNRKESIITANRAVDVPNDITYSTVSEIRYNDDDFDGCTVTKFYNGQYFELSENADLAGPFQNKFLHYGSIKEQHIYDSDLDLLQKTTHLLKTVTIDATEPNTPPLKSGITIYPLGGYGNDGCYNLDTSLNSLLFSPKPPGGSCPTDYIGIPGAGTFYNITTLGAYGYNMRWVKDSTSTSIRYEGGLTQTVTTTNTYGSSNHYLPTKTVTLDSRGGLRKMETVYNVDYADLPTGYPNTTVLQNMVNRNQLLVPVERTEYYSEVTVPSPSYSETSRQWLEYKDFDTGAGLEVHPYRVYVSKDGDDPELRMVYSFYDDNGQLGEVHYPQDDAARYTYIWGYKGDYLLAEIKNLRYGNISLDETLASSLSTLLATSNSATATEGDVRDDLEDFRALVEAAYPNCQMTGYVHQPGVGVKSVSDVRGYTTYYYYDQHNRLWYATDQDGKILSLNDYNLREN